MINQWRRSSVCSANGSCVEVMSLADGYMALRVEPTRIPASSAVVASPDEWAAFIAGVKAGEFDD